jgi:hypothetical protein
VNDRVTVSSANKLKEADKLNQLLATPDTERKQAIASDVKKKNQSRPAGSHVLVEYLILELPVDLGHLSNVVRPCLRLRA